MTEVYFIRHAEPNYENHNDLLRELTPKGLEDRRLVTSFLMERMPDVLISSPYRRAVDTVDDFARKSGKHILTMVDFRERKVGSGWIDDFNTFARRQWEDFDYKLDGGESLKEVQSRNIDALFEVLEKYSGQKIVIGSHGTALSTVIRYYDQSFGYADFMAIKDLMPWIVQFTFDGTKCRKIQKFNLFEQ